MPGAHIADAHRVAIVGGRTSIAPLSDRGPEGAFIRTPVTNAGIHFFEHVKIAFEYLDLAIESAGMSGRVGKGSLKIGIFSSLASGFLLELLRCYSTRHPEVEVSIVEGAPRENLARLRMEQLDIAFVMGEPIARDCDVVRF